MHISRQRTPLYNRHSIFAAPLLRRIVYAGGHAVHSTFAFRIIREILMCRYFYYAYTRLTQYGRTTPIAQLRLWFRLVARFAPHAVYYGTGLDKIEEWQEAGRLADKRIPPELFTTPNTEEVVLLCTASADEALTLMRSEKCLIAVVLLVGIRSNHERWQAWRTLPSQLKRGVVLDLYDCALLVNRNSHLSVYKAYYR